MNGVAGLNVASPKGKDTFGALQGPRWRKNGVGLALRAGYNSKDRGGDDEISGSVGFRFEGLNVDYAQVTQGEFDASHRVSVGYRY
jgi:hypothetical protein